MEGCAEGSELWWGGRRREAAEDPRCAEEIGGIGGCPVRGGGNKLKTRRRDGKRRDREMNKKYSNFAWTPNRGPLWKARAGNPGRETPPGGSHPRTLSWGWRNFREGPDGVKVHINNILYFLAFLCPYISKNGKMRESLEG